MKDERIQPFSEILDALFHAEQVPVHLLFRLSDMPLSAETRFFAAWPGVDDERRQEIMGHLVDLAEDNFAVDFTPIFKVGLTDPAAAVRILALDGIWDATDVRLISPVLTIMQTDENLEARAAAARALAHFVVGAEGGESPRRSVEPGLVAVWAAYEDEETAVPIRRAALEALGAASHPRVNAFIEEAYEHDDPAMRLSAIFAMGNSADPRWLPTILEELTSPIPEVRAEAATAAGAMGSSDAIPLLTELTQDEDDEVIAAAIVALGQIGGEQVQAILSELLEDPDFEDMHELIQESLETLLLLGGELDMMDYVDDGFDEYDDEDAIDDY
mgnify:FL=1